MKKQNYKRTEGVLTFYVDGKAGEICSQRLKVEKFFSAEKLLVEEKAMPKAGSGRRRSRPSFSGIQCLIFRKDGRVDRLFPQPVGSDAFLNGVLWSSFAFKMNVGDDVEVRVLFEKDAKVTVVFYGILLEKCR